MNRFTQNTLIALLLFTPLAFGSVEIWAKSLLQIVIFSLMGIWLIRYGTDPGVRVNIPGPLFLAAGFFVVWVLIQQVTGTSLYLHGTEGAMILGLAYLSVFMLVVSSFRSVREIDRVVLSLIIIGFGIAVFAIVQKYTWNGKMFWLREIRESGAVFGPFVNRNHFAGYMEMVIPVSLGYTVASFAGIPARGETVWRRFVNRLTSEQANKRVLLIFMTLVMSVSLVLTLSRAGLVSFMTALLLVGVILFVTQSTRRWITLPVGLVAAVFLSLLWFGLGPLIGRYQTLFHLSQDTSMAGRIQVWGDVLKLVNDYPVMGSGLGTFEVVYPAYQTISSQIYYGHAHNDYLQLLAETGWLGFAMGMSVFGMIAGFILSGWRRRRNPWSKALLMGVSTGILSLLIHGLSDFNFHIPGNAILFSVLLGLGWNLSQPDRSETRSRPGNLRWRLAGVIAGLVLTVFLVYQSTLTFAADFYYRSGKNLETNGDYREAGEDYQNAIRWNRDDPRYHLALGVIYERLYVEGDRLLLEEARREIQEAIALSPTRAEPRVHLGWIYSRMNDIPGATTEFKEVLRLAPTNNNWRHYVGIWFAETGQKKDALEIAVQLRENGQKNKAIEIEEKVKGKRQKEKGTKRLIQ